MNCLKLKVLLMKQVSTLAQNDYTVLQILLLYFLYWFCCILLFVCLILVLPVYLPIFAGGATGAFPQVFLLYLQISYKEPMVAV